MPRVSATARARAELATRLASRRAEIEDAALARIRDIADPAEVADLSYLEGLRGAASAAVDFGLAALGSSRDRLPLVPSILLSQARLAARSGVGLDTVMRRYTAGHALLVDFLVEEVERDAALPPAELRKLLAISSAAFDRLLAAVCEEHARELERRTSYSPERRLAERVERLLAGEPIDTSELPYEFGGWHLAIVARGGGAREQLRSLAAELDCLSLIVVRDGAQVWAWLGSRQPLDPGRVVALADPHLGMTVALGEPADGLGGWRLTHRQARAALPVARRRGQSFVRYAEVALVASALQDEVLVASLRRLFLTPLEDKHDGGRTALETLRAYVATDRNVASAAAVLRISRQAMSGRLKTIQSTLGRQLSSCTAELEVLLDLVEME